MFFQDLFTSALTSNLTGHTSDSGHSWAKHTGFSADITLDGVGGEMAGAGAGSGACYEASASPASAEYDVQGTLHVYTRVGQNGLAGRIQAGADTMYLAYYDLTNLILYKGVAGAFTNLGSYAVTLSAGNSYVILLQIRDAAKKIFLDGVERVSSADNAITGAGKLGIRALDAVTASTGMHFDDISGTDTVAAGRVGLVGAGLAGRSPLISAGALIN